MYKIPNPELFRNNVSQKFNLLFDDELLSKNMEKGIFNFAIKEAKVRKIIKKWENPHFSQLYVDRFRTLYLNLKNDDLLNQIKNKDLAPQTFAFMTHQEMNPQHWRSLIEQKIKRDANKFTNNIQASTDMFTCKKCKSKRCTYYELQTRSADEPATIFVTCLDCGKNWKS
jgi:transcription elongation factor S-II